MFIWGQTWLGINDIESEGDWVWETGDPVEYTNWCGGEPNNWGKNEDCVVMKNNNAQCWNDLGCNNQRNYVCQYETEEAGAAGRAME